MKLDTTYGSVTLIGENDSENALLKELEAALVETDNEGRRDIYEDGDITLRKGHEYTKRGLTMRTPDDHTCLTISR